MLTYYGRGICNSVFYKMAPYYSNHFVAVNEKYCKSPLLSAMEQSMLEILESMMGFERGAGNVLANL